MKMAGKFVTLETRGKLGRINFRKDFWDWGQGKNNRDFKIQRRDGNKNV